MYGVIVRTSARDFRSKYGELVHKVLKVTAADRAAFIKLYLELTQ